MGGGNDTAIIIAIIVIAVVGVILLGFFLAYLWRGQVSGSDQVLMGREGIAASREVGVAEAGRYAQNPNLTTVMEGGARPPVIPVMNM